MDFTQAINSIQTSQNILILPSSPPDGDSIGSALAMYLTLRSLGKNATVVLSADVPEVFKFLPEAGTITKDADLTPDLLITIDLSNTELKDVQHEVVDNKVNIIVSPQKGALKPENVTFPSPEKKYDLIITVDTAALEQLGEFYETYSDVFQDIQSINIDHHASNTNHGSVNIVDPKASSACEILAALIEQLGVTITPDLATLLLAGIITDTGSFQNPNTTPESFDLAANLIDKGARQQEIIKNVYKTKQLEALKLWGRILSNLQVDEANKLVWSTVSRADLAETGAKEADTGDIIDELMGNAQEAEVVLLLKEKDDGTLHGSIRTTTDSRDATKIAANWGGGGHPRAAGFNIPNATIAQKEQEIIQTIVGGNNTPPAPKPVVEPIPQPEPVAPAPAPAPVEAPIAEPVAPVPAPEPTAPVIEAPKPAPVAPEPVPVTPQPPSPVVETPPSVPEGLVLGPQEIASASPEMGPAANTMGLPGQETPAAAPDLAPFNLDQPAAPAEETPAETPENKEELIDQLSKDFVSKEGEKPSPEEDDTPLHR